jgi:predicted transcriptional regulator
MTVKEFAEKMNMRIASGMGGVGKEIAGMYAGDLLSWVMSHAGKGDAWVTVLTSINVVAVAALAEVSCVIIPENIEVDEQVLKRAEMEDIAILCSEMGTYEICWRAHCLIEK